MAKMMPLERPLIIFAIKKDTGKAIINVKIVARIDIKAVRTKVRQYSGSVKNSA